MRKLEVIVLTLEDARQAQMGGAHSLEIVQDLAVGGLTPLLAVVQSIRDQVKLHLRVIVRPHARNFVYSPEEIDLILMDIDKLRRIGVEGIVFGALHPDSTIDLVQTAQIAHAAHPLEVTFHRAIDVSKDAVQALPALKRITQRVLTSGLAETVWEGRAVIRVWVEQYSQQLTVACGGGIRLEQLSAIVHATDAPEYHVGRAAQTDQVVDSAKVRQLVQIINLS